jgi:hypothetical protein
LVESALKKNRRPLAQDLTEAFVFEDSRNIAEIDRLYRVMFISVSGPPANAGSSFCKAEVSECIRHVKAKRYSFPALWIEMADKSIEPTPVKSEVL